MVEKLYFYGLGEINGNTIIEIVEKFIHEMEKFGIRAEVINQEQASETMQEGIQTIALFCCSYLGQKDFHFIRKDKEGGWSHKLGWFYSPCKLAYNYENIYNGDGIIYELIAFFNLSFL